MKIMLALLYLAVATGISTARGADVSGVKIEDKVVLAPGDLEDELEAVRRLWKAVFGS